MVLPNRICEMVEMFSFSMVPIAVTSGCEALELWLVCLGNFFFPIGFSRQEYWSGLPCPPPGDLPEPGIQLKSPKSPALACGFFTTSTTCEAQLAATYC